MSEHPTTPSGAHGPDQPVDPAYLALGVDAQRVLAGWAAPDEQQEGLRTGLLAHLEAHPGAMARDALPSHLTASALVLDESLEQVLLTLHRKARLWLQFGGHYEVTDRTVLDAATREATEESGVAGLVLHPEVVHLDWHTLGSGFTWCTDHLDLRFAGTVPADVGFAVSEESADVRWWPVDGLPADSAHEIAPLVAAARRVLG